MASPEYDQRLLAYISDLRDYRSARSAYFEKLALLDGGIIALVITAILGPLRGQNVPHENLLGVGLTILVVAMLVLLNRNMAAMGYEEHATMYHHLQATESLPILKKSAKRIYWTELTGVTLTQAGISLLLVYVWLMLSSAANSRLDLHFPN